VGITKDKSTTSSLLSHPNSKAGYSAIFKGPVGVLSFDFSTSYSSFHDFDAGTSYRKYIRYKIGF
jgi:hypothetical protein